MAKDNAAAEGEGKKGGKKKLLAIVLPVVLLLVGGGVYFFVIAPGSESSTSASASSEGGAACEEDDEECAEREGTEATPTATEVPGAVVTVDPVTINLSGGHFLKVGLAMQATADAGEEVDPGKAADALITEFSGRTVDELATAEGRETSKKTLLKAIKKAYEKKVYEIYYTSFVMN